MKKNSSIWSKICIFKTCVKKYLLYDIVKRNNGFYSFLYQKNLFSINFEKEKSVLFSIKHCSLSAILRERAGELDLIFYSVSCLWS